jgi:hypothetical protein
MMRLSNSIVELIGNEDVVTEAVGTGEQATRFTQGKALIAWFWIWACRI